jgi:signal transduction histidine kinase
MTHRIRSLYAPAPQEAAGLMAVIQVGASLEPLGDATRNILFFMVGTVILGTVATFFGAGWLADSAVGPVTEITDQARAITAGTLSHRITAHADVYEFQGLVHVLNGMLARLDGAMRAQRRIIADVGHDLRTPITAMTGQLEVALRSDRSPDHYRQVLSSCLEEALHMGSIGDALVMLARLEADELRPEPAATDLAHLARQAIEHVTPRAGSRRIVLHAPPQGVTISADSGMLRLVFDHLLDNAIQHTPPKTRVEVSIDVHASHVVTSVDDNGPGMPPDQLPLLFERFYRRDTARQRTTGAGLSLTIAAAIVGAHGGLIEAEQSALGGLKISMRLPKSAAASSTKALPGSTDEDPASA